MTARRRLFFLPIAALLATACGGLVESEPTVQGPPIGEHDAGAPIADASVSSSSPPTPTGKAPVTSRCLMSDGPFEITGSQAASQIELAVRVENGKVGVYVSNNLETHRYILTNEAPCLLDRDLTFGTNGKIVSREGSGPRMFAYPLRTRLGFSSRTYVDEVDSWRSRYIRARLGGAARYSTVGRCGPW